MRVVKCLVVMYLVAVTANAGAVPMTIGFSDDYAQALSASLSGTGAHCGPGVICAGANVPRRVLSVPSFDRSMGELVSARLQIRG